MPESDLQAAALAWHDAGFCVLPAASDGSKRVGLPTWKAYETTRPSREQVSAWATEAEGIGLVMGAVSGQAEMLEVEGKAVELVAPLLKVVGEASTELLGKLMTYVEVTPSGGYHWIYRVQGEVGGNTKLASRPADVGRDTLLETRGEGGWVVVAPSCGDVHPSRKPWATTSTPGVVATLTASERDTLHAIARLFDQMPEVVIEHREPLPVTDELTPGQDYEARTSWAQILEPQGWKQTGVQGDKALWTRPGKDSRHGPSATVNYDGNDNLYVFSSSTAFEPNHSYTKFAAYAVLAHHGDYSAAARELRRQGYGSAPKASTAQAESRATLDLLPDGTPVTGEEPSSPGVYPLDDSGNARRLIDVESTRLRFSPERKKWSVWDGSVWRWLPTDSEAVRAFWQILEVTAPRDEAEGKWLAKSCDERAMVRAVKLAARHEAMQLHVADLDSSPYELNTPTGVVDLLTTILRPARPDDLHSKITSVGVDPEMPCPKWLRFLAETFGDPEIIAFMQRLAGYSATGAVTWQILPFLHGVGANGKSVFTEVMVRLLGDYATVQPADFLLAGGRDEPWTVARLSGMRLVLCSEVPPTAKFHEQKIKMLTGGDSITARFMRENEFTFAPTHHLWLAGNHQPTADAGGHSLWRRLRHIAFPHVVPEERQIEGLADQLVAEEGPAILAWVVEGARQQIGGLREPESVMAATRAYAEEEDHLGRFLDEEVWLGGGEQVRLETSVLYAAYLRWCAGEHEEEITRQRFGRELKARGIEQQRSNGKRFYLGVSLARSVTPDRTARQLIYGDE